MGKTLVNAIKGRRRELGNQYAFSEELSEIQAIHANRKLLQNPYAHVEEIDRMNGEISRFDGLSMKSAADSAGVSREKRYTENEIQQLVRQLQLTLWKTHKAKGGIEPLDVLNPLSALKDIGYQVECVPGLGSYVSGGRAIEVGGLINGKDRVVKISGQQPTYIQNFTAAHELGHALLHEGMGLHRDMPLEGVRSTKDRREYEADKFAAFFLMPKKLVTQAFEEIFGRAPFFLTDETIFALSLPSKKTGGAYFSSLRDLSKHLSSATTYNGTQFVSLCARFQVSSTTMAIRLEELGLVHFN